MTSVELKGEHIYIRRSDDDEDTSILTFAEVTMAAEVLRKHLLSLMPPEIPEPRPALPAIICQECGEPIEPGWGAHKRVRVTHAEHGWTKEYLPGSFHPPGKCPPKPPPGAPRR